MAGIDGLALELSPAEQAVAAAVRVGAVATPSDGSSPDPSTARGWASRTVRGAVLVALCTSEGLAHRSGVRIRGALIDGPVDLSFQHLTVPLFLDRCRVAGRIDLSDASCPALTLAHCRLLDRFIAPRIRVVGSITLTGTKADAPVELYDAHIGADLDAPDVHLTGDETDPALLAAGIDIGADLVLERAVTRGTADFSQARVGRSLLAARLDAADDEDFAMRFSGAHVHGDAELAGGTLNGGLDAERVTVDGTLDLRPEGKGDRARRFSADDGVHLAGARLGTLDAAGAMLTAGPSDTALDLWSAHVARDVSLGAADVDGRPLRFEATGSVILAAAQIAGAVVLRGARLEGDPALDASRARIDSVVLLSTFTADDSVARFEAHGRVVLADAHLGALRALGGLFSAPDETALDLFGAHVSAEIWMRAGPFDESFQPFEAEGLLELTSATIGGDLICDGARLIGSSPAISALRLAVAGEVHFNPGVNPAALSSPERAAEPVISHAAGTLDFSDARLGAIDCAGASVESRRGQALVLAGAEILGNVLLSTSRPPGAQRRIRCEMSGGVDLGYAHVHGGMSCRGARLADGAIDFYGATIGGDLFMDAEWDEDGAPELDARERPLRLETEGEARLTEASVGKNVFLTGAWLHDGVDASRLSVGGGLNLDGGVRADSTVRLDSAAVGELTCHDARLTELDAPRLRVSREFSWRRVACQYVSLRNATVTTLDDDLDSWPEAIDIEGFTYQFSADAPRDWRERADWLDHHEAFSPQPYHQLASAYRLGGDELSARKIAMERFNSRLREPAGTAAERASQAWRWLLRVSIGHGYEPWRALVPLAVLLVIGTIVIGVAARNGHVVPVGNPDAELDVAATDCTRTDHPCLEPVVYTADLLIPVVNLGQRDRWRPTGPLAYRIMPPLLILAGWALTTLVVAGFTGLVRRE